MKSRYIKHILDKIFSGCRLPEAARYAGLLLMGMICFSCVQDDFSIVEDNAGDMEDAIRIKATISPNTQTRTYYGNTTEEAVSEGTFYITYPRNTNPEETMSYTKYDMGTVVFGNDEDPFTGYAYFEKDGVKKDLKWRNIKGEGSSSVTLFIHNIPPELYTIVNTGSDYNTTYRQKYSFKAGSNPYVASPLDTVNGSNDLIICGGSSVSSYGGKSANSKTDLEFNLYHRLSLLKLNFDVYASEDQGMVDLTNAKVYITNLYTTLSTINLYYCTNSNFRSSSSSSSYQDALIQDKKDQIAIVFPKDAISGDDNLIQESIAWKNVFDFPDFKDEEGEIRHRTLYCAQPFIFPPQAFSEDSRPQIIVEVPKEDVTGSTQDEGEVVRYTGYLPTVMYTPNAEGEYNSVLSTALTSGYVLNVTATINSPNSELSFAPVKVENWVSKNTYSVSTKKAGIYSANDFNKLIDAYQKGRIGELERYGFQSGDNTFVFQLWANIILDETEIEGMMEPGKYMLSQDDISFSFLFNGYAVTLSDGDEDEENDRILTDLDGQQELYKIVTGQEDDLFFGIRDSKDFKHLIELCHPSEGYEEPDKSELMKYGNLNSYDNSWTFYLKGDVELDIEDIYQKIDMFFFNGDFKLNREGHSITLNIGEKKLICEYDKEAEYDEFLRLARTGTTYGITAAGDFYLLVKCYNDFYTIKPELISLFAPPPAAWEETENKAELSWVFYFRASMTVDIDRIAVKMKPDAENGRPKYSFYSSGSTYDINFVGSTPFSTTTKSSSTLYYVTAGTGYVSSSYGPSRVVNAYQNNTYSTLWACGYLKDGVWNFSFTYPSGATLNRIDYNDFFGSMILDENDGKYDYNFNITQNYIRVENCPQGSSTRYFNKSGYSNNYPSDEAAFKRMANGTYWDEVVEP